MKNLRAIALSTSWNASYRDSGLELVREISGMGFDSVELSFNLTEEMVKEIIDSDLVRIVSLHNFCPVPKGLDRRKAMPDYFSLASLDEGQRRIAIEATCATIDTAVGSGARAVVLHAGRVEVKERTRELIDLFEKGEKGSAQYCSLLQEMEEARSLSCEKHLEALFASLEELAKYSGIHGVYLGLENRFYYNEIPAFEELEVISQHFSGSNILYWHDFGHGHVWFNLAGIDYRRNLEVQKQRLLGVHIHDVVGSVDHLAPFTGEIDFAAFKDYLSEEVILVMEAHKKATAEEILAAKRRLENL